MIKINIDMSKNIALKKTMGESIHMSLMGSPAYISNEILLNVDQDPNNIILLVGEDNDYNTEISVEPIPISKISENTSKDYKFSNFSNKIEVLLSYIFASISYSLFSAQNEYVLSTSNKPLYSGCFEDEDSVWVQKFIVVFDKDFEATMDKLLIEFGVKDILYKKSTSTFEHVQMSVDMGYVKIKDGDNTIYIFVVSKPKQMIGGNLEFLQNMLYSMIHQIISSLPDKFFTKYDPEYFE